MLRLRIYWLNQAEIKKKKKGKSSDIVKKNRQKCFFSNGSVVGDSDCNF